MSAISVMQERTLPVFRELAKDRYAEVTWPHRGDERWRYAKLALSKIDAFGREEAMATTFEGVLPAGVEILDLQTGLDRHGDRLWDRLLDLRGRLGAEAYVSLGQSMESMAGSVIHVAGGTHVADLVRMRRRAQGSHSCGSFLTVIFAEPGSSVTVLEEIEGEENEEQLVIGSSLVLAAPGARINYVVRQDLGHRSKFVHDSVVIPESGATGKVLACNFGGGWVRQEMEALIEGRDSHCELLALNLLSGDQEVDQRTLQNHECGGSQSNLLFKNALFDQAHSIFGGLIRVGPGAHQTDAFQTCRNLMLSDEAESNAMPGLEILADQVKCSHGSTSGQVDPAELFYLRSRGIPEARARKLVTYGFAREVVEHLEVPAMTEILEARIWRKLEEMAG